MNQAMLDKVLRLDLDNLTEEEHEWLHDLKNKATVLENRLRLKAARAMDTGGQL